MNVFKDPRSKKLKELQQNKFRLTLWHTIVTAKKWKIKPFLKSTRRKADLHTRKPLLKYQYNYSQKIQTYRLKENDMIETKCCMKKTSN